MSQRGGKTPIAKKNKKQQYFFAGKKPLLLRSRRGDCWGKVEGEKDEAGVQGKERYRSTSCQREGKRSAFSRKLSRRKKACREKDRAPAIPERKEGRARAGCLSNGKGKQSLKEGREGGAGKGEKGGLFPITSPETEKTRAKAGSEKKEGKRCKRGKHRPRVMPYFSLGKRRRGKKPWRW